MEDLEEGLQTNIDSAIDMAQQNLENYKEDNQKERAADLSDIDNKFTTLNNQNNLTTAKTTELEKGLGIANKCIDTAINGVSAAVAMANLPSVGVGSSYSNNLSASYGFFGGSHSVAIGLSGITANDRVSYKISTAFNTKGDVAFGIGLGINFGQKRQTNKELMDIIEKLEKLVEMLRK